FHAVRSLLADGHAVTGVDNFSDYYSVRLKRDRHAQLEGQPGYHGVELDLCDAPGVLALLDAHRIERVCHLAAQPGVRYSVDHPFVYQKANLDAFLSVLEGCRHAGVHRLVYASSSSVYGGNTKLPFSEDDPVDSPISLYAATKKANELMAHAYTHLHGLQTVGLRFFTVYGPWGRPDMAVWLFTEAMVNGRPIKVFNHGRMERDFTFVSDIVLGIKAALFKDGLAPYEVMNLGNHRSEKLLHMIGLLSKALGKEPKMEFLPIQDGDVPATFADIERARAKLGFEPATPIEKGIPEFANWYLDYHGLRRR
ncbi:MAG: NAD-dependent epimerase/dehydratase family protein, partial [Lentisphaerae bacterium]|nr:NAD-dependent epimerase/dehydratase family protein [Lentisphaerota bacterium]